MSTFYEKVKRGVNVQLQRPSVNGFPLASPLFAFRQTWGHSRSSSSLSMRPQTIIFRRYLHQQNSHCDDLGCHRIISRGTRRRKGPQWVCTRCKSHGSSTPFLKAVRDNLQQPNLCNSIFFKTKTQSNVSTDSVQMRIIDFLSLFWSWRTSHAQLYNLLLPNLYLLLMLSRPYIRSRRLKAHTIIYHLLKASTVLWLHSIITGSLHLPCCTY